MKISKLLKKLEPYKKSSYIPTVENNDGKISSSKFSGLPFLNKNEEWPVCPNCKKPLNLFIQLNLAELPDLPTWCEPKGLVQLFYCTNTEPHCEVECEAYLPFSKSVLVRLITDISSQQQNIEKPPTLSVFEPKRIVGWEQKDDYPNWEELSEFGLDLTDDEADLLDELNYPIIGDKLLGCPAWVQAVEYPNCPECGETMKLLFQINSEDNLPYMFGDNGCSHITQCPNHPKRLAFGWACH